MVITLWTVKNYGMHNRSHLNQYMFNWFHSDLQENKLSHISIKSIVLFEKKCIIKQSQKSAVWGTRSDKPSVSNWLTSWQTGDTRDILFTVIQHYIDSGEGTALCEIKRPLKIHFAFGNNNKISMSIRAPVSVWPSIVRRVFVIEKQECTPKFDFLWLSGQFYLRFNE